MSTNYKDKKFQELLDKLQQESWQLELIISGFAIFGLFTVYPKITLALQVAQNDNEIPYFVIMLIALIACSILLFNLLVHVILRGLWIGALGLRYVSGDIDFESLNYHNRFTKYLKKKIVSFDKYVATLENYCSVLFAVSFLLIFYVISITMMILAIVAISILILDNDSLPKTPRIIIGVILLVFFSFGAIFTFLDFITQGYFKKKNWLSKIYFPFYWVFSFVTLTFLYRPLVYNFLDDRFTKRLSFFLVPAYITILIFTSFKYKKSNYLHRPKNLSSTIYLDKREYDDLLTKEKDFVKRASIQSKVITDPFVKIFRVFDENVENNIYKYHPSLKPKEDERGFKSGIHFSDENNFSSKERDSLSKKYLAVFNLMYKVQIDSINYKTDFLISKNKQNQIGFETYISTSKLIKGKHTLKLNRNKIKESDTTQVTDAIIPFWYFK